MLAIHTHLVWEKVGEGTFEGERPTYMYPAALMNLICARLPQGVEERPEPTGPSVCQHFFSAFWPVHDMHCS